MPSNVHSSSQPVAHTKHVARVGIFWVPQVRQCSPQLGANIMYSIASVMEQQGAREADVRKQARPMLSKA